MEKIYTINVAGVIRDLPIIKLTDSLSIASFVILGDAELVCEASKELADKVPKCDYLVTAEAKGIPLTHELAKILGMKRYIVARKSVKAYMDSPISIDVNSITTQKEQTLCLNRVDADKISGKKVVLIDDVISTGDSIDALKLLCEKAGSEIVGKVCILTEGSPDAHKDVISLGNLPLF